MTDKDKIIYEAEHSFRDTFEKHAKGRISQSLEIPILGKHQRIILRIIEEELCIGQKDDI